MIRIYYEVVLNSLNEKGFVETIKHIWFTISEITFDLRYATETRSWIKLSELDINSPNVSSGTFYAPTRAGVFRKLMRKLKCPKDAVFIDFGCGKGKTLILAMEQGFNKIIGVDFSGLLCEIATRNVEIYKRKTNSASNVEILLMDAVDYEIKDEDVIFYFFNPFDDKIFEKILINIKKSLENCKRKIWIIYYNPIFSEIFDRNREFLPLRRKYTFQGHNIFVYENNL